MLESMRKHMTWMMWVIVGLITVTFLFFGIYPSDSGGRAAAVVNGDVVTLDEWNRVYQNMSENYRQIFKDQFNEGFSKMLRSQALRELIQNRLLVQEAKRIGLKVSDDELRNHIQGLPIFSQQGKFDMNLYERYLDYVNQKPAAFEAYQRDFMIRRKMEKIVEDGVDVTDAEVASLYASRNPKAKAGDFEKNKTAFRQTALSEKQRSALEGFIRNLQAGAKIKISERAQEPGL